MSLTFGPEALTSRPVDANDVEVTVRGTDTPATLSVPVAVTGANRISFTVAAEGRYTIAVNDHFGTSYKKNVYLQPDSSGGVSGPSVIQVVEVTTGTEERPEDATLVFWLDLREDRTENPDNMGAQDLRILGTVVVPDTENPTAPSGLGTSSITETGFTLSWAASTDNVAVTGYAVRIDGGTAETVAISPRTYEFTDLTADTTYTDEVRARDAAGNLSAYASLDETTSAGSGPSSAYSIYGASAPTGSWTLSTDGTPYIVTGRGFYKFSSSDPTNGLPNGRVVGGRAWLPVGATGLPTEATFTLYGPNADLGTAAVQTKVVSLSGATAGSWVEGIFDTPQAFGSDGDVWIIGVRFTGGSDAGKYVFGTGTRSTNEAVVSLGGKKIAWSEASGPNVNLSSRYKISTGSPGNPGDQTQSYGVDILVDAGA